MHEAEVRWICLRNCHPIRDVWSALLSGVVVLVSLLAAPAAPAQESDAPPRSRAETIRRQRQERAATIPPKPPPNKNAQPRSGKFSPGDLLSGGDGWSASIGRVAPGQGYALGPVYKRLGVWNGRINWQAALKASPTKAWGAFGEVAAPNLYKKRVFGEAEFFHIHGPRYEYYGPGPDSSLDDYANYRLEQNGVEGRLGFRPARNLRIGWFGGFLRANPGPGTRTGVAQVTEVFAPRLLPAIDQTLHLWRTGLFASYDSRDNPGGPRGGGLYQVRWEKFADGSQNLYGFQRLRFEGQKFAPIFNKTNVLALRLHTTMTWVPEERQLPFYLQATLGGPRELRGFPRFRFHDQNSLIATAEYRWRLFSGMDAVAFLDAGKVTARAADLGFTDLESSAGVGVRLRLQGNVFMRVETAFSHEGTQFWVRFSDIFRGLW